MISCVCTWPCYTWRLHRPLHSFPASDHDREISPPLLSCWNPNPFNYALNVSFLLAWYREWLARFLSTARPLGSYDSALVWKDTLNGSKNVAVSDVTRTGVQPLSLITLYVSKVSLIRRSWHQTVHGQSLMHSCSWNSAVKLHPMWSVRYVPPFVNPIDYRSRALCSLVGHSIKYIVVIDQWSWKMGVLVANVTTSEEAGRSREYC